MTGPFLTFTYVVSLTLLVASAPMFLFLIYAVIRYCPVIGRIFEERPMFMPLMVTPDDLGESVSFRTEDGLVLQGSYLATRSESRVGTLVFCHEFLSDRWSYIPYLDHLRDQGFDIFCFDFRNHGSSPSDPDYSPLQWATDHEVRDLKAALVYLRSRPDRDHSGFGLFGISRGGSTALLVAADEPDVWGVVTDGAFPTRGTMTAYIVRWAEIYVRNDFLRGLIPHWMYSFLGRVGRRRSERRLNCRFPDIESAVARLAPRPWLMIHGQRDVYIGPEIARGLFEYAREPREMWLVPDAKHNRCREIQPDAYVARVRGFLDRYAPRLPIAPPAAAARVSETRFREVRSSAGFGLEPAKIVPGVTATAPIPS